MDNETDTQADKQTDRERDKTVRGESTFVLSKWKKHVLGECQHAVVSNVAFLTERSAELLLHLSATVKKVDLGLLVRRTHLTSSQTRHWTPPTQGDMEPRRWGGLGLRRYGGKEMETVRRTHLTSSQTQHWTPPTHGDTEPRRWGGLGLRRYGGKEMGRVSVKKIRGQGDGDG